MRENVKVIIVTHNSTDCIADCLKSLKHASERINLHVTIIDNASADNTLGTINNVLDGNKERVKVVQNPENRGYAHGNNVAIKAIDAEDTQYVAVLILNPDVTLTYGIIDALLALLHDSDEVGAVSPNVIEPGQSTVQSEKHNSLWGWPMRQRFMGRKNVIEVDRLHGGCMLIKPELFERVGLFDESYFLYWEEIDLCQRARRAGFKLLYLSDVVVTHRGNSTSSQHRTHRIYYMWRNQFMFAKKNYASFIRLIFLTRRVLTSLKELVDFVKIRRFDVVGAAMAGLAAGLRGETGKSSNRYAASSN